MRDDRNSATLALGWVRTTSGIYQNLYTRVCSALPPYTRSRTVEERDHDLPSSFRIALERDQKCAKRPRLWRRATDAADAADAADAGDAADAAPAAPAAPAPPAAPDGAPPQTDNWLPASLYWTDLYVQGKSPVNILNELGPKVFRCYPEFPTTTQEDPINPYLTTVLMEGVVIARGAFTNKKMSRQLAAREALRVLCPLLRLATQGAGSIAVADEHSVTQDGVLGARSMDVGDLEGEEVTNLRRELTDDRILECTVGKTPIMVLQEHCHKHVGRVPTYEDVSDKAHSSGRSGPQNFKVKVFTCGFEMVASDITKKKARQRVALEVLRRLYPRVKLYGDLVVSMNSRQRIARSAAESERRKGTRGQPSEAMAPGQATPCGTKDFTKQAELMLQMVQEQLWNRVSRQDSPQLDVLPQPKPRQATPHGREEG